MLDTIFSYPLNAAWCIGYEKNASGIYNRRLFVFIRSSAKSSMPSLDTVGPQLTERSGIYFKSLNRGIYRTGVFNYLNKISLNIYLK